MAAPADTTVFSDLSTALRKVQELRASVSRVFTGLSEGLKDGTLKANGDKVLLSQLEKNLLAVNSDFSDLQKIASHHHAPPPHYNASLIVLDPVTDRHPLFTQLLQTHKWANKLHEHAALSSHLLQQNLLKRSHTSGIGAMAKKTRRLGSSSHAIPPQAVDSVVQGMDAMYNNMSITVTRPFGQAAVLVVTLAKTLRAVIVLRGLLIEWVSVKGFNEDVYKENKQVDIWSPSKYAVYRKVSDHASSAMLHFYHPLKPELALRSFMLWLHAYVSLFSTPCHKCNKFLVDNLPPTWRDMRFLDAYHENCRTHSM
ncbi:hypothetical protein CAPTEDRAFT_184099 [Capitella teleta]|uniref:Mediator of RNA polymerase II transcription subunit 27 n=1 Tax=Capitella teleta TaxID=283909 RepID=R7TW51_CAPTE|nr:hypothetical protein CAPTEDRAFT_184099 [Capitella teleta]|eukprot:ELT95220.1 hypothetical protein CAPTEDRAFT_184099 [Capitella teleta]